MAFNNRIRKIVFKPLSKTTREQVRREAEALREKLTQPKQPSQ